MFFEGVRSVEWFVAACVGCDGYSSVGCQRVYFLRVAEEERGTAMIMDGKERGGEGEATSVDGVIFYL